MNKEFLRRLGSAKWVVPVAVLILTLSIGSIAFAVTGSTDTKQDTGAAVAAGAGAGASGNVAATTTTVTTPALVLAVQASASATGSAAGATAGTAVGAASQDALAIDQIKENAILDLLRQKMAPADQATLDQLRAQAAGEQTQLLQIQASLDATTAQITDLVNKYLGITTTTTAAVVQ